VCNRDLHKLNLIWWFDYLRLEPILTIKEAA
jgi:hypothetical protein